MLMKGNLMKYMFVKIIKIETTEMFDKALATIKRYNFCRAWQN